MDTPPAGSGHEFRPPRPRRSPASRAALLGAVLVAAGALVRVPILVRDSDGRAGPAVVGLTLGLVIVAVIFAGYGRRMRRQLSRVAHARPDAEAVLVMTTPELLGEAHHLGVSTRRISATSNEYAVLAVRPGLVEIWFRGDDAPRWSVGRAGSVVTVEEVRIQLGTFDQLRIAGPGAALDVIPVDPRVTRLLSRAARRAELERTLRLLGADLTDQRGTSGSGRQFELPT